MFRVKGGDREGEDWRIATAMSALPRRLTTLLRSLSTEDIVADQLAGMEARSLEDVRRTINAIADEMYRPPWK